MPRPIRPLLAFAFAAVVAPSVSAQARGGVWKVGDGYVIRLENADLSRPADRQLLLAQIERAAAQLCRGQRPQSRRDACAGDAVRTMMDTAEPAVRAGYDVARFERDGTIQAQR